MHFKKNKWFTPLTIFFCFALYFCSGISFATIHNIPDWVAMIIFYGIILVGIIIYILVINFTPLKRIQRKIKKQENPYSKISIFINEYLPESKKRMPRTIYKYVSLFNQDEKDREEIKKENEDKNNERLSSLKNNQLWNARSDKFNDPFEKFPYIYDGNITLCMIDFQTSWLDYVTDVRAHTYMCSFSEVNNSVSMWAHYANGFQGFCLEYEVINKENLWNVTYDWGRHCFGSEFPKINIAYQKGIISKEERDRQLITLHKYWSTFKSEDWKYEREIRALFYLPEINTNGINLDLNTIGLKIKSIIIGCECSQQNQERLMQIANQLNIPVKKVMLNYNGTNYIKFDDLFTPNPTEILETQEILK